MNNKYLSIECLSVFYSRITEWITLSFSKKQHIHAISEIDGLQEKFDELTPPPDIETSEDVIIRINQLTNTVNQLNTSVDILNNTIELLNDTVNILTPAIGEIYISVSDENPSVRFGGVWEQIKDAFLLASGDLYSAGSVGGESEHVLSIEEIPSHSHTYKRHEFDRNDTDPETGEDVYGANNKTLAARTGSTDLTGGGQAHNNMPPYLAVYIWKRVS